MYPQHQLLVPLLGWMQGDVSPILSFSSEPFHPLPWQAADSLFVQDSQSSLAEAEEMDWKFKIFKAELPVLRRQPGLSAGSSATAQKLPLATCPTSPANRDCDTPALPAHVELGFGLSNEQVFGICK